MAATASPAPPGVVSLAMFDGDTFLGQVEVLLPVPAMPWESRHPFPFPSNEIRISHRSPPSDRCPPLAVLQAISPYSLRCKLQAKPDDLSPGSSLHMLHFTCWKERMTAVVDQAGDHEELHLMAMQSMVKGLPCFWCWSARSGLYAECLGMLNQRCLAIVFDLDETLVVSNSTNTFDNRMDRLSDLLDSEVDVDKESTMCEEFTRIFKDRDLLQEFVDTESITVGGKIVKSQKEEALLPKPGGGRELGFRPVIRVPGRNVVLTRINPKVPQSSVFVNIRPGWEYFKSYLTANGRRRFKVYVCTMAGRDYAHEIWRLLDPEASLISSEELSERLICVKPNSKKSLERVFKESLCHPNMSMVIDDRLEVWDEKDKRRVHVVPAYNPSNAPEDKVNGLSVLQILKNVACNVRGGFFREFDGNLLKQVDELMYENEVLDLPYTPDVGDYLLLKDNNIVRHSDAPIPEDTTSGVEAEESLNGQPGPFSSSDGVDRSDNASQTVAKGN